MVRYTCPFCPPGDEWHLWDHGLNPENVQERLEYRPGQDPTWAFRIAFLAAMQDHNREIERQIEAHLATHVDEMVTDLPA